MQAVTRAVARTGQAWHRMLKTSFCLPQDLCEEVPAVVGSALLSSYHSRQQSWNELSEACSAEAQLPRSSMSPSEQLIPLQNVTAAKVKMAADSSLPLSCAETA